MKKVLQIILLVCIITVLVVENSNAARKKRKKNYRPTKKVEDKKRPSEERRNESKLVEVKSNLKSVEKSSMEYIPPQRLIAITPFVGGIYAKDLFTGVIKDGTAIAAGIDIKFQFYGNFGLVLDGFYSSLKNADPVPPVINKNESPMLVFTGGFYYSIFNFKINMSYGAITASNEAMMIFMPGIEYYQNFSSRISGFVRIDSLITNDWIVNENYIEKYTSGMLAAGISFLF